MDSEKVEKGTSGYGEDYRKLWMPIVKDLDCETGYMAVLSDNSMDRDDEFMGKSALDDFVGEEDYLAGLVDHENKILNQVCKWINRRVVNIKGHDTLIAEPKFFLSNPTAKILKDMLDEGAQMGISIGAIVKSHENKNINGKNYRVYTRVEPVEASFVAVPANKHAHAIAISKSLKPTKEVQPTMDKTYNQVEVDELSKKHEDDKLALGKKLDEANEAIKALETEKAELAKKHESEKAELEKKLAEHVEKEAKATLMKGAEVGLPTQRDVTAEVEAAIKAGQMLVMRKSQ